MEPDTVESSNFLEKSKEFEDLLLTKTSLRDMIDVTIGGAVYGNNFSD
jgi:hypothetical protein